MTTRPSIEAAPAVTGGADDAIGTDDATGAPLPVCRIICAGVVPYRAAWDWQVAIAGQVRRGRRRRPCCCWNTRIPTPAGVWRRTTTCCGTTCRGATG